MGKCTCAYECVCVHVYVVAIMGSIIDWYGVCVTLGISCKESALSKHLTPKLSCSFFEQELLKAWSTKKQLFNRGMVLTIMKTFCFHSLQSFQFVAEVVIVKDDDDDIECILYFTVIILFESLLFHSSLVCVSLSKVL